VWWRQPQLKAPFEGETWLGTTVECADEPSQCKEAYLVYANPGHDSNPVANGGYLYSFFSDKKVRILNITLKQKTCDRLGDAWSHYKETYADLNLADGTKKKLMLTEYLLSEVDEDVCDAPLKLAEGLAAGSEESRQELESITRADNAADKKKYVEQVMAKLDAALRNKKPKPPIRLRPLYGNVDLDQYMDCVPDLDGIEAVDSADRVLWQRLFVGRGPLVKNGESQDQVRGNAYYPYVPSCFTEGQYLWDSAITGVLLGDGTAILSLGNLGAVRIRLDGKPTPLPENVRVYDFKAVADFKHLLYTQSQKIEYWVLNEEDDGPAIIPVFGGHGQGSREFDNPNSPANFMIMQYYLFPELLKKPASATNSPKKSGSIKGVEEHD
jgi:hypothetical protein